jgi:hypothetical protein
MCSILLRGGTNASTNKERCKVLCEQAAVEQDPKKLHELIREIREINDLLEAKEARLKGPPRKT